MKHIDEYRDAALARRIADGIAADVDPSRSYAFMEFCGGHTHAVARHGITRLLPPNVRLVHGPGCPVCVLPVGRIDQAIRLALDRGVVLCTYGDTMRVPASGGLSLTRARARGADIRVVYAAADALRIAEAEPAREVVFLAIGFETTTPPTALAIRAARQRGVANFSVLCCHVLTPAAIGHVLGPTGVREPGAVAIDGVIGPAHVSVVIGSRPYEAFAAACRQPVVIAGFEPLDLLQAVRMLVRQVNDGRAEVENEYLRAVTRDGNATAQAVVAEVFEPRASFEWRGLGEIAHSALRIRPALAAFDAEHRFDLHPVPVPDHKGCDCGAILRGVKRPADCRLFGTACTPDHPMGACMVSQEGACAAHWRHGRLLDLPPVRVEPLPATATATAASAPSEDPSPCPAPTASARSTCATAAST